MGERFALLKPAVDAHTLGLNSLSESLKSCGYEVVLAPPDIAQALDGVKYQAQRRKVAEWVQGERITRLGLSYRLDPQQGQDLVGYLLDEFLNRRMLVHQGGQLRGLYFAGLPEACTKIELNYRGLVKTFQGGESLQETLLTLGIPLEKIPFELQKGTKYDQDRLAFGEELVAREEYRQVQPFRDIQPYPDLGTKQDSLEKRLAALGTQRRRPLFRAHAGPYSTVQEFLSWVQNLASNGYLDILSIGTSQLSQSHFGEDWKGLPNGGGVPVNSAQDYRDIWDHSRPLLVRTYAGTKDIPSLATLYEETINICWHALSFWWFNQLDGRGPYSLLENLKQHLATTTFIAQTGKPLEANVSHHFAFRGADDLTYLVSAYLAAKLAKQQGIRTFILQNMLNTPRQTWGVQDLAKSRALLSLVKSLEDQSFQVLLQPRAGLDYFHHDLERAKAQLAAVTALMDDIDPHNYSSPPLIHVVSYSEGSKLATPEIIDESIQISYSALTKYREMRKRGLVDDYSANQGVQETTNQLIRDARSIITTIEEHIPDTYSAEGFFKIFVSGFLPVPFLWNQDPLYQHARKWNTQFYHGGVRVVDEKGEPMSVETRLNYALSNLSEAEYALRQSKEEYLE